MNNLQVNNQAALNYFEDLSNSVIEPTTTKIHKFNDFSAMDAEFILKYVNQDSIVLDVATGTGITLNKYYEKAHRVVAVEKFEKFSALIVKDPRVEIVNEDMFDFDTEEKFDIVTLFGIMHYASVEEAKFIYQKYKKFLKEGGKLLIKQQFGVNDDVIVNGYSEELKKNYYAEYRHLEKEIEIIKSSGYKNIQKFDIYPPEFNRWENTHFWALVAEI